MSSVKKTDKSRKAKATIARAALKSRTTAAKTSKSSAAKSSAAKTRPVRAKTRTASAAARTATKAKTTRKPASTSSKSSAAAKLRAAQARAKKQVAAAKAARPAAKSSAVKSAAATRKTKTNQTATAAKLKRSTDVSRGKSRAGRNTPVEAKLAKAVTTVQQPAAPQTKPEAVVKKVDHERRAQVAAVLALRSLRKPAPAAEPVVRPEASKVSVTQKAPKKAAEAAPAPTRVVAPVAPKAVAPSAPEPAVDVKAAAPIVEKPKPAKPAAPVKHGFKPLEFVVYPAHGVGQILAVEEQEVAGFKLELFVISFSKDKMILKVPTPKSIAVGMRKLAGPEVVKHALNTLTGRARIKRTMWSRRAQEYEAKINSGDLVAIAEVVRDLYRSDAQPEQSYSERQLYEAALDRVAREIAAVQKLTETESLKVIEAQLQKSPRRSKADEADADAEAEAGEDGGIDEAA